MLEVTNTGHNHSNAVFIAVIYGFVVADATAGLYHSSDACLVSYLYTVGKWEECIGCHNSLVEVELKAVSFFDGLLQCIYARCLTYAACHELLVLCQNYSVALAVLHYLVGEKEVLSLLIGNSLVGGLLEVGNGLYVIVALLHQSAIET